MAQQRNTRTSAPARTPARTRGAAPTTTGRSSGYRGAEGMRKMQEEHERQEAQREASRSQNGMPFRFFVTPGESREIVVIDEQPDFFRYEHNLKNRQSGKWDVFLARIAEQANCPACRDAERPAYFAMYLTVIDLTPFTTRDGDEVEWSKKLLVIKPMQQKKIARLYERHGTLRGMVLQMTRDGDKDAAIGGDIEFIEFMDEDQLDEYVTEYTDQNGTVHEVIGGEVFDYDALFPEPTEEHIRALVGGRAEPGSRADEDRELGRGSRRGGGRDRDDNWQEDDAPPRGGRAPAGGRRAEPAPAPRSARAARGREAQEEEEPAPAPQRTRAAGRGRTAEPEDAPDDPPARGSMADRRRALRGNGRS